MRLILLALCAAFAQEPAPAPAPPAPAPPVEAVAPADGAAPVEPVAAPEPVPHRGTVLFIHGLYLNHHCWDNWGPRFEAAGYTVLAPDWPGHAGDPPELRANTPAELRKLKLDDVVDYYRQIVLAQPEPPALVGHSMGGLIVQILLSEGLGKAGVAIHSAPPKGVFSYDANFLKSNRPTLRPGKKPILLTPEQFQFAFGNGVPETESNHFYDWYVVPESRPASRGPITRAGRVKFEAKHAPLLFIAGEEDHVIPAALNRTNVEQYPEESGLVELQVMPGRTHLTLLEPGWEGVADKVIGWLGRYLATPS